MSVGIPVVSSDSDGFTEGYGRWNNRFYSTKKFTKILPKNYTN